MADSPLTLPTEFFKSLLLSFSPNLDEFNPNIPEWRQDVGRVIKKALLQVSDFHFLCPFPLSSLPSSLYLLLILSLRLFSIISYTSITSDDQYSELIAATGKCPGATL